MGEVLRGLRSGEVVTYGEVAAEAGHPGAARAVGNVLARSDGLPWWRVVTSTGRLVPGHEAEQGRRLRAEGVELARGKVRAAESNPRPAVRRTYGRSSEEVEAMEAPKQVRPKRLNDYLEVMTKAVFQSGISWRVIEAKWSGFTEAFSEFDPDVIAALDPPDIDRLAQDQRIVRNRKKIEATVANAAAMLDVAKEHGSFKRYLRSHGGFDETVADLRKRFRFLGDTGAYFFLYVVGEEVPPHEEWMKAHARPAPRARAR